MCERLSGKAERAQSVCSCGRSRMLHSDFILCVWQREAELVFTTDIGLSNFSVDALF